VCHASVARFPHLGNLPTLPWHTFHVLETLPRKRGTLSTSWKPPHASVAHFPRFGNLATLPWHAFHVLETSSRFRGTLSTFWKPPHASVAHFPRLGVVILVIKYANDVKRGKPPFAFRLVPQRHALAGSLLKRIDTFCPLLITMQTITPQRYD